MNYTQVFLSAEAADPETTILPASGVPDAIAYFPLTALTSAGGVIVTSGGQTKFTGSTNIVRCPLVDLGDSSVDSVSIY